MEDYNLVMFTDVMDFFKERVRFEKPNSITSFYKLVERFVDRGLGNTWQFVVNKIHEIQKTTICNFR
jgi:hypothetical protein